VPKTNDPRFFASLKMTSIDHLTRQIEQFLDRACLSVHHD
jgi:hypothetical protein